MNHLVPYALRLWLLLEISAYLAIARQIFDAGWPAALLGALGGLLGLRAGLNAITWIFGIAHASPAPPIGPFKRLGVMLDEYLAYLLNFLLVTPFEPQWMPPDRLTPRQTTLLLVHGYGVSRGCWWLFRRRLEAAGYTVATISLVPPFVSIGKMVPQLNQRIEEVCAATGCKRLTLVAHSMGGLVCRSYLARHGNARIERLITLASPHAGSELAHLGFGQNAREMEPNSLWLCDLAGEKLNIPAFSLRNLYDNYVMPQDNQRLPGASDIELPPVGHIAMLNKRWLTDIVIDLCRKTRK